MSHSLLLFVFLLGSCVFGYNTTNTTDVNEPAKFKITTPFNGTAACVRYAAGRFTISLTSSKRFVLFVPQGMPLEPRPLLFNFHGYSNDPANQYTRSKMEPAAQKYMAYTITPEGSGAVKGFNAGACCPLVTRDDVQFTREMHQWAVTNLCIDLRRVYSTGFSNGGFMSHRLACQASDIIKGIAPHSGTLGFGGSFTSCQNPIAQPVLAFHGTEDPTVPYNGGSWPGFQTSFNGWRTANNCPGDPHRVADRSPTTFCWEYDRCTKGGVTAPVMFCTIRNLAHKWSGGNEGSGANPNDIDATDYMWQFFNGLSDIPQPTLIN